MTFTDTIDRRQLLLCFQVHQPLRLRKKFVHASIFDDELNEEIIKRAAEECYIPTNKLLLKLIERYPQLKVSFTISGTALEQMEQFAPEALESFKRLAATGSVEFLSETYFHSLAFLFESEEFEIQILEHSEKIVEHFGLRPTVFMNTNLIYNDEIGRRINMMGLAAVITEGSSKAVKNLSPHYLFSHRDENGLKILMRNRSLSDDIAFRVALSDWHLTAETFMAWLHAMPDDHKVVTVALDYGTFGVHHKPESGVMNFLEQLLLLLAIENTYVPSTPSEVVHEYKPNMPISIPDYVAIEGCDLADFAGSDKQREALAALMELEHPIKEKNDSTLVKLWRSLQTVDHLFYMSENAYRGQKFSPFDSAEQAHEQFMAVITYLKEQLSDNRTSVEKINDAVEAERRRLETTPSWAFNINSNDGHHNQSNLNH